MAQAFTSRLTENVKKITQAIGKQKIDSYTIEKQYQDFGFSFLIADADAKHWYDNESKEVSSLECKFIQQLTHRGDIVFECGTHHGLTAILLSHWVGIEGQVISFEINHKNAQIAKKNIELNQIENVIIEEIGLGSRETKQKIFDKSNASVTPANIFSVGWLKNFIYGTEYVNITTLDSYAKRQKVIPTFLKIDVEGYETEVLKGGQKILQNLSKLEIEIHTEILPRYNTSVKEIFELIDIDSYQTWIQWDDKEEPLEFDMQRTIDRRVHLFAIPKSKLN